MAPAAPKKALYLGAFAAWRETMLTIRVTNLGAVHERLGVLGALGGSISVSTDIRALVAFGRCADCRVVDR